MMTLRFSRALASPIVVGLLALSGLAGSVAAQESLRGAVLAQVTPEADATERSTAAEDPAASGTATHEQPRAEPAQTTPAPTAPTSATAATAPTPAPESPPTSPTADDSAKSAADAVTPAANPAQAQSPPQTSSETPAQQSAQPSTATEQTTQAPAAPLSPLAAAIKDAVDRTETSNSNGEALSAEQAIIEREKLERDAIASFYQSRSYAPLWVGDTGPLQQAKDVARTLAEANAYGLEASDFAVPSLDSGATDPAALAAIELKVTRTALLYARYARGGRIMAPAEMLNTNLDRKPQLLDPKDILTGLASTSPDQYLVSTHPKHPQFEKLRQAFLAAGGAKAGSDTVGGKHVLSTAAKRLRANMEEWRWMHDDLGKLYVFNNIPEFMQYVYKDGQVVRKERIVAGMLDKQSSIFTRNLKHVVLRPKWRVPKSIMVHELWPSLRRGGGLMRQYGLQIETKEGKVLDWRKIDWSKDDIRNYHVMQPPGGRSVLGVVKFSFPSQHTIFMHDTPDKWMFRQSQRTLSHGCLRVKNPVELAEIVLSYDKGWDKAKIAELIRSGPLNNEVALEKRVPIHLAYFTSWVEDDGKVRAFPDIYGHERRITQALDGQWDKINKGRDHLAPPQPNFNTKAVASSASGRPKQSSPKTTGDIISDLFGLSF